MPPRPSTPPTLHHCLKAGRWIAAGSHPIDHPTTSPCFDGHSTIHTRIRDPFTPSDLPPKLAAAPCCCTWNEAGRHDGIIDSLPSRPVHSAPTAAAPTHFIHQSSHASSITSSPFTPAARRGAGTCPPRARASAGSSRGLSQKRVCLGEVSQRPHETQRRRQPDPSRECTTTTASHLPKLSPRSKLWISSRLPSSPTRPITSTKELAYWFPGAIFTCTRVCAPSCRRGGWCVARVGVEAGPWGRGTMAIMPTDQHRRRPHTRKGKHARTPQPRSATGCWLDSTLPTTRTTCPWYCPSSAASMRGALCIVVVSGGGRGVRVRKGLGGGWGCR